jgi:hypothetical protein
MLKNHLKFAILSIFASFLLSACLTPNITSAIPSDDEIKGPLTTVTTWKGLDNDGNPITYYINSTYIIDHGGDLTIETGAIIKFGPNGLIRVNSMGSLKATGAIFTSYRDPRGKILSVAGNTAPAPGDWKQIHINGGTSTFINCEFSYGGNGGSTLYVDKNGTFGKARIDRCLFSYNDGSPAALTTVHAALHYDNNVDYDAITNSVTNSVFYNNVWPLSIPATFSLDRSNRFGLDDGVKNTYNFVHINSTSIKQNVEWNKQDVPYIYLSSLVLSIHANGKLTIKGGDDANSQAIICFATKGMYIYKGGELDLSGHVKFTNSPISANTMYNGLYCAKDYHYKDPSVSVSTVLLTSNGSFIVENYEPTSTAYTIGNYAAYKREPIKAVNVWETRNW